MLWLATAEDDDDDDDFTVGFDSATPDTPLRR
jgi:hypothetical protein